MQGKKPIIIIILAFAVLSVAASVINPLHEATDELRHYRFVQHIVQTGRLPVQGALECRTQSHHPPLFYSLGALATFWIDTGQDVCAEPETNPFWNYRQWEVSADNKNLYLHSPAEAFPWSGAALAAHLVRLVNVLIGAATVYLTWLIGRAIWPKRPYLAVGGAAFVAFNPMFVYMAGAINNDVIAALSGTAVALACVRLVKDENGLSRRWGVVLGQLYGLALLSKFNLLALGGTIGAAATWVAWRRGQWRQWVEVIVIAAVVTLLLSGWWFVRNVMLYGEPTGVQRLTELWGVRDPSTSWGLAIYELKPTWTSLWGRFGYGQIPLPEGIYVGLLWVIGIALLGLLIPVLLRRKDELKQVGVPLLVLVLNVILGFVVVFYYLLISPAGAMGRFFYPALSSLSILAFYGLSRWLTLLPQKAPLAAHHALLAISTNLGMGILTIVVLWGYLAPAYARPPSFAADTAVPHPTDAQFDGFVVLRGYEVQETAVAAGDPVDIDLYWEVVGPPPGNYLLFVHLIDSETGVMVVQRDTHPGLGRFPSRYWQPGDRFVDSIRMWLPETAYTPSTANLSIGLYVPGAYRLGITGADGTGLGDALPLGEITLNPATFTERADYPNPQNQNFADTFTLLGYEYDKRLMLPGDLVTVTTYWQTRRPVSGTYRVETFLRDEAGLEASVDVVEAVAADPFAANLGENEGVTVVQTFRVPPALPPGSYAFDVRIFDVAAQEPLNLLAEDGHILNNHLLLSRVGLRPFP